MGVITIFNTDQASQFTSNDFTDIFKNHKILIFMDGKGCWMDNVFIERLWRSLKYECVYIQEFDTVKNLRYSISEWIKFYNTRRPYLSLHGFTPDEVYYRGNSSGLHPWNRKFAA